MKPPFTDAEVVEVLRSPDLVMVGLVFAEEGGTRTLWCNPDQVLPEAASKAAAMVLVESTGISVLITDEWKRVGWFTEYVKDMTRSLVQESQRAS
jgi:hypothetical protein